MNQNLCKHLRTKAMYVSTTMEEALAEKEGPHLTACHYWCNLTQTVVGMDDRPVHKETCDGTRKCFEA
ncbi:MAG TPA: hypothetical protein VFV81_02285 [Verrucomicrobiae bacterium]|nr:hypothetical protein [Verrucomicrobiae bacterium]